MDIGDTSYIDRGDPNNPVVVVNLDDEIVLRLGTIGMEEQTRQNLLHILPMAFRRQKENAILAERKRIQHKFKALIGIRE